MPPGVARLLQLLHWIIGYGQLLATTVQRYTPADDLSRLIARYRTRDIAAILARLQRGLLLAAGLQAKLDRRTATGRDIPPVPPRFSVSRPPKQDGSPKRHRAPWRPNLIDLPLDRMPTAEQIALELRRRPIGAILVDICRDLGIRPGDLPPEQWRALQDAIAEFGGNLVVLLFREVEEDLRKHVGLTLPRKRRAPAPNPLTLPCPTGPP